MAKVRKNEWREALPIVAKIILFPLLASLSSSSFYKLIYLGLPLSKNFTPNTFF
tara:strand:- start:207 stop:368 length:162 start_codon:yes stop_codon:yes gene_type:complete